MSTPLRTVLAERGIRGLFSAEGLPSPSALPRWLAPLPVWLENFGLHLATVIALVNLVGTAFGFWYYGFHPFAAEPITWQFALEPVAMWLFVPDSPVATLFIALALLAWRFDRSNEYLNALAFFGCIKLGLWTPYVLLTFKAEFSYLHWAMYNFLFWSHLAMVLEAFLLHRFADFPVRAVGLAAVWYGLNDVVDYFVPIVGPPHHTTIPAEQVGEVVDHSVHAHDIAAAGAVVLTLAATFLTLATRVKKLELGALASESRASKPEN